MSDKHAFLDELVSKEPFYRQPRFWVGTALVLIGLVVVFFFFSRDLEEAMSSEEVAAALQVAWHDSLWVDKVNRPNEVIVVPEITFKLKNTSQNEIRYVHIQAVFTMEGETENLGDGFVSALQQPLPPGEISPEISVRSSFGYSATSKKAFYDNIMEWKRVNVRLFARARGSGYVLLGTFPIKQAISGVKVVDSLEEAETGN